MGKRRPIKERLIEVLVSENSAILSKVRTSLNYATKERGFSYTLAYQDSLSTIANAVARGSVPQEQLESLALQFSQKLPALPSLRDKEMPASEYYSLRHSGKTHKDIVSEHPGQRMHLRALAGNYARYGPELKSQGGFKKAIRAERRKQEITGDLYRKLFKEDFGRANPRNIPRSKIMVFDHNILGDYIVPHGKNSLRAYRARMNYGKYVK